MHLTGGNTDENNNTNNVRTQLFATNNELCLNNNTNSNTNPIKHEDMFFEDNELMQIPAPPPIIGDNTAYDRADSPAKKLSDLLSNPTKMMTMTTPTSTGVSPSHLNHNHQHQQQQQTNVATGYERSPSNPNSPSPLSPAYSTSAPAASTLFYNSHHHHNHHHQSYLHHHNVPQVQGISLILTQL